MSALQVVRSRKVIILGVIVALLVAARVAPEHSDGGDKPKQTFAARFTPRK